MPMTGNKQPCFSGAVLVLYLLQGTGVRIERRKKRDSMENYARALFDELDTEAKLKFIADLGSTLVALQLPSAFLQVAD